MLKYDKTLKVGDLITSYSKGVFRITDIQRRFYAEEDEKHFDHLESKYGRRPIVGDEYNPLVVSRKLLDSNYKKRGGKESCDASFCSRLDPEELQKVELILSADASIEQNSIKKYNEALRVEKADPPVVTDDEVREMKCALDQCTAGQSVEELLGRLCPALFRDIKIANGFVNAGKQFAVYLNENYSISVIYNELEGGVTEFISGEILERGT